MLAAKAALAIRVDALGEDTNVELGMEHRAMLEKRMRSLEEGKVGAPWVLGSACQWLGTPGVLGSTCQWQHCSRAPLFTDNFALDLCGN